MHYELTVYSDHLGFFRLVGCLFLLNFIKEKDKGDIITNQTSNGIKFVIIGRR